MLIDAQDVGVVVEHLFKHAQARLAEVAETRVVIAALCIVIVRNNGCIDANCRQDVEPVKTLYILTNFVHLVNRHSDFAKSESCSRSEGHDSAIHQLVNDAVGNI